MFGFIGTRDDATKQITSLGVVKYDLKALTPEQLAAAKAAGDKESDMGIFGAGGLVVVAAGLFAYHKKTKAQQEKKPDDYDETDYYDVRPMTFIQMSMIYNNINVGEYTKAISLDPESKRAAFARARMETSENVKLRVKLQLAQKKLENERTANLNSRILMVNGSFPLNQMEVNVFRKFLGRRVTLKNVEELPKEKLALEAGKKAEDDFMAEVMKAENSGKVFAD